MLEYFRSAIALRHRYPALRQGAMTTIHASGAQIAFVRHLRDSRLLAVVNAGDEDARLRLPVDPHFPDGTQLHTVFGPACQAVVDDGHLRWDIPARTASVMTDCEV